MDVERLPVVALMGPTAAGKTELAVELVRRLPLEIVSVDSAMVYRGMDIGTAKPDAAVRAVAPHRLIDIRDPADAYSAGEFRSDALAAIEAIALTGRVPLLVGGTMLYFRVLEQGLAEMPQAEAGLRESIDRRAARDGWPALHAELARLDPGAGARIHPNDAQRIQRALEVIQATGQPISELQRAGAAGLDRPLVKIVLEPADRGVLAERIGARFASMMDQGLLAEVAALHQRVDLHAELPALRAVGYRQLWAHLDGACSLEAGVERAIAATRQLAKRQLTWLRSESCALRPSGLEGDRLGPILGLVETRLGREGLC